MIAGWDHSLLSIFPTLVSSLLGGMLVLIDPLEASLGFSFLRFVLRLSFFLPTADCRFD